MVKFLPLILDKLIGLVISPPLLNGQQLNCASVAFDALAIIVGTLTVSILYSVFIRLNSSENWIKSIYQLLDRT